MSHIPVFKSPFPNELLYSWVHRLAEENALQFSLFAKTFIHPTYNRIGTMPADIRFGFYRMCECFYTSVDSGKLYESLTNITFESLALTRDMQIRCTNNAFRTKNLLNVPMSGFFQTLYMCPECFEEDIKQYKRPYFHREHHMSGVKVCPHHHCALLEYKGKRGHACEFKKENFHSVKTEISNESLDAYADYAYTILKSGYHSDAETIRELIYKTLKKRGYSANDHYQSLKADIKKWAYYDLINFSVEKFFMITFLSPTYTDMENILPVCMFLFPDVNKLLEYIKTNKPLIHQYICKDCNQVYYMTEHAHSRGWKCPHCTQYVPEEKQLKDLINNMTLGHYNLQGNFLGLNTPTEFYHCSCKTITRLKPRSFLFEGVRCICESTVTKAEAKNNIESLGDFKLINYTGTLSPITVKHLTCGQTFVCNYHKFINFPGCRICNASDMTDTLYEQRIKELVGDEYSIIKGFVDQHTKVSIRHEECGTIQYYKPSSFLDGQRCPYCHKTYTREQICDMLKYASDNRYKVKQFGANVWTIKDLKTNNHLRLPPAKIIQELLRPTPSPILDVDQSKVYLPKSYWKKMFDLLVEYKEETDSVSLSKRTIYKGENLGQWCYRQQQLYHSGKLKPIRLTLLKKIDFNFNNREHEWDRRFKQYERFVKGTGRLHVRKRENYEGEHLGAWIQTQKLRFKEGKLSDFRVEKLKSINPNFFNKI